MGDVEEMLDELEDGKPRHRPGKKPAKRGTDDGFDLDVESAWSSTGR